MVLQRGKGMQISDSRRCENNNGYLFYKTMIQVEENRKQTADSGQQTADSRQQTADSRQQTADSRKKTADSRQQTADSRKKTADSRQQTADSRQQIYTCVATRKNRRKNIPTNTCVTVI
jgi:hypothetical protein